MDKTTEKQIGALGLCAFSVIAVLFLPQTGWPGTVLVTGLSMLVAVFGKSVGIGTDGRFVKIASTPIFVWNLIIIGKLGWELCSVIGVESALPAVILLLLGGYAVKKGVVPVVGAVLMFFLVAIYGSMYVFALLAGNIENLMPTVGKTENLAYGFLPMILLYMYIGERRERGVWALGGMALALGATLVTAAVGAEDFYSAAKSINLFGTMERWEPLVGVAVTGGGFCLLSLVLSVNKSIWENVWNRKKNFPTEILVAICIGTVFAARKVGDGFWALGTTVCWGLFPILTQFVVHKKKD